MIDTSGVQLLVTLRPRGHLLSAVHFGNYTAFAEGVASSVTTSRVAQCDTQRYSSVMKTNNASYLQFHPVISDVLASLSSAILTF